MDSTNSTTNVASTTTTTATSKDDEFVIRTQKLYAIEQLHHVFGFSHAVAQQAVDDMVEQQANMTPSSSSSSSPLLIDITACYNYILDRQWGHDQGGPVLPIDTCPHIQHMCHQLQLLLLQQLQSSSMERPFVNGNTTTYCSYVPTTTTTTITTSGQPPHPPRNVGNLKSDVMYDSDDVDNDGRRMDTNDDGNSGNSGNTSHRCNATENWWCLQCGIIRCSRYCSGHAVQHWEETRKTIMSNEKNSTAENYMTTRPPQLQNDNAIDDDDENGHCCAVSLSDLSVWCHVCQSYLSTTNTQSTAFILQPLLQQLEHDKFRRNDDTTNTNNDSSSSSNQNPNVGVESRMKQPSMKKIKHTTTNDDNKNKDDTNNNNNNNNDTNDMEDMDANQITNHNHSDTTTTTTSTVNATNDPVDVDDDNDNATTTAGT